jgi:hypothetical protein
LLTILWAAVNIVLPTDAVPQASLSHKWLSVTVCDVLKAHVHEGAQVMIHATVLDGQLHGILLEEEGCDKGLSLSANDSVRNQEDYKDFMSILYSERKDSTVHVVVADFYGTLVYVSNEPRLKWTLDLSHISSVKVR